MRNQLKNFLFYSILLVATAALVLTINLLIKMDEAEETADVKISHDVVGHQLSLNQKSKEWLEEVEPVEAVNSGENQHIELAAMSHEEAFKSYPSYEVVATGYTAGYESTGKTEDHPLYGVTFSGHKVQKGVLSTIAADPRVFPLGTVLYVPGYGYGIVMDTGGAIKGNKIDLYYETVEQVYDEWGKKSVDIYVIEKGDGKVTKEELAYWENQIKSRSLPVASEG